MNFVEDEHFEQFNAVGFHSASLVGRYTGLGRGYAAAASSCLFSFQTGVCHSVLFYWTLENFVSVR